MTVEIRDYPPVLREATAAGFEAAAIELQQASLAAFTTSSEIRSTASLSGGY
jgi:hypothetical protein